MDNFILFEGRMHSGVRREGSKHKDMERMSGKGMQDVDSPGHLG